MENYGHEDENLVKARKTRRDVLTIAMAIHACKSSKLHKLKPRQPNTDRTKMPEAKSKSKACKMSHSLKLSDF